MNKKILILAFLAQIFFIKSNAQITPCSAVINVEITSPTPQSGPYNYFGIIVTLNQTYTTDVTVKGYIHDEGENNTDHPFEITVHTGNTTNQTSSTFYQTSPVSTGAITITSIAPFIVTNGSTFFNTFGDCIVNSQAVVDTTIPLADSLEAAHDFLNNTIELNEEEYLEFLKSIVKNGVAATALSYNIDSNAVYTYVDRSIQASESSIDITKSSLFGSKPFDSLTNEEIILLGNHLANANVAGRIASAEIGGGCLASFMIGMVGATINFLDGMNTWDNATNLSPAEIAEFKRIGKKIYLNTVIVLVSHLVGCLS